MKKIGYLFIFILYALRVNAQHTEIRQAEVKTHPKTPFENTEEPFKQIMLIAQKALTETPDPIQTISTEGKLKGDPVKTATQASIRDFNKIYALAVCYKTTEKQQYLDKYIEFMLAWARTNQPGGNPINDTNLDPVIEGYQLIKSSIPADAHQEILKWLKATATAEIESTPKNQNKGTAFNNWNSHRLKIIGEIGFATGDNKFQQFAIENLKKQLAVNLLPDGSSIDFKLRDALHYHVYDLEPLLTLSIVIKKATKQDFYNYQSETGSSLKKSVEWLVPYLTGEKTHEEFVHSTVAFDQKRANNGEAGYQKGTLFNPLNGLRTLVLAGYFDPSYDDLYNKVKGDSKSDADWLRFYRVMSDPATYFTGN